MTKRREMQLARRRIEELCDYRQSMVPFMKDLKDLRDAYMAKFDAAGQEISILNRKIESWEKK